MPAVLTEEVMKMKARLLGLVLLSLPVVAVFAVAPALAEERTCRGTLGATTVDNLRVPSGATCTLTRTRVKGTLKVERGATLYASAIRVVGSVQAENARRVNVVGSSIGGSVQIVQSRNGSTLSRLHRNSVRQDVQYFENRGAISITRNRIIGNLQCKANNPRPSGGGNVVGGSKQDQCARL
jgi:hypothetical protein